MIFAPSCSRGTRAAATMILASLTTFFSFAQAPTPSKNIGNQRLKPGNPQSLASTGHPLRMRTNPAFSVLQQINKKRVAAGAVSHSSARPVAADQAPTVAFPGYVQAPWVAGRQSTDTASTISAVTADFNGDGKPDVASLQNDGTINVLLSSTSGSFIGTGLSSSTPLGTATDDTSSIFAADMNHDGKPDLVALTTYFGGGGVGIFASKGKTSNRTTPADTMDEAGSYVLIYLNDGTGKFAPPLITSLQTTDYSDSTVWNFAVGDVNGDGINDMVVISNEMIFDYGNGTISTQDITVEQTFINDGTGVMTPLPEYDYIYNDFLQPGVFQESLVDMNHDGKLDLVSILAPNGLERFTTIQVQLGNGDGTFAPLPDDAIENAKTSIPLVNAGDNLVVADVNNDGYPDAVFASNTQSDPGQIFVALNKGDGTLGPANSVVQAIDFPYLTTVSVADVSGDGNPDLLVYASGLVSIYTGKGDGTFSAAPISQYVTGYTWGIHPDPADFDGDGKLDIADVDEAQNKVALYSGNGDGTFHGAPAVAPPGENASNVQVVATGDALGVSKISLIAQDWAQPNADFYPNLYTASPDGNGGLKYVKAMTADVLDAAEAQYVQPITADFNNDGASDLIIASSGGISISLSNKDGSYAVPTKIDLGVQLGCSISFADAGDVNHDGFQDIVFAYQGDTYCYDGDTTPSGYFVLINNQDGTFTPHFTAMGTYVYQPKLIDLNGDGALDLVIADDDPIYLHFTVTLLPGKGDGTFDMSSASVLLSNYSISSLIAGDFNNDGKQDLTIATAGATDSDGNILPGYTGVALLAGHGDFTFDTPSYIDVGHLAAWGSYADLNGDGLPDLVLADIDSTTGEPVSNLVTLINNGGGAFSAPIETYQAPFSAIAESSAYTSYVFTGDINLDGTPDVITTGSYVSGLFVNAGGVTLAVSYDPTQLVAGQSTTLTATLTSTVSSTAPNGGTVTFLSDGVSVGSATVSNGVASTTTTSLTAGAHTLEARYSGDPAHNAAVADTSINVLTVAPDFVLAAPASSTVTLAQGASTTVTMSLTANETFNGTVQFSCSGAPSGVTCTPAPSSLNLSPGQTGSVTINLSAGSTVANNRSESILKGIGGYAVAMAVLILLPIRRRPRIFMVLVFAAMLGATGLMMGCGGDGNKTISQSQLTITATAGGITKTQTISLTVTRK